MFVGLDVRAWSVTGHPWDAVTDVVWWRRLTSNSVGIIGGRGVIKNRPLAARALRERDGGNGER
jgi:hypothetical protein